MLTKTNAGLLFCARRRDQGDSDFFSFIYFRSIKGDHHEPVHQQPLSINLLVSDTLQLHVGQESADPASDSRAVPIYQTTSYVFRQFPTPPTALVLPTPATSTAV